MYVPCMPRRPTIRAWRPAVAGVAEVLHATFPEHAYPAHAHDTWTLLLVDSGTVRYDLERHEHGALGDRVTLLPAGSRPAEVAVTVGFHDQAHLTRHFRRLLGVTPTAYARSAQ